MWEKIKTSLEYTEISSTGQLNREKNDTKYNTNNLPQFPQEVNWETMSRWIVMSEYRTATSQTWTRGVIDWMSGNEQANNICSKVFKILAQKSAIQSTRATCHNPRYAPKPKEERSPCQGNIWNSKSRTCKEVFQSLLRLSLGPLLLIDDLVRPCMETEA